MIDDHVVVQVHESMRTAPSADEALLSRVEAAYARAGLEPKIAKRFRFADEFNAIGARIDGRDAWVSAKAELLLVGLALSVGLVSSGWYSGSILASTVECWVQILIYRRAGFCLLDRVFRETSAAGPSSTARRRLPAAVADELLIASLNVACWGTELRASVSEQVFCTDASGGASPGAAGVASQVPGAVARELWRHRDRRGRYVRKESAGQAAARRLDAYFDDADEFEHDVDTANDPRWFGHVADALGWTPYYAYSSAVAHINIQEMRAVRTLVRRLARAARAPQCDSSLA